MWMCNVCEQQNRDEDKYCIICGTAREEKRTTFYETVPPGPPKPPQPSKPPKAPEADIKTEEEERRIRFEKYDNLRRRAAYLKVCALFCVLVAFSLFSRPYIQNDWVYTIYNVAAGWVGQIEQICSIVLIGFALLPAIFILIPFGLRKRNLPVTISAVSAAAITIYCCVIWFGNAQSTAVPFLIILAFALCALFSTLHVRMLVEMENVMNKAKTPKAFVSPKQEREVAPVYPKKKDTQPPDVSPAQEKPKSRIKSTMRH
jgi:hypothetical protein